MCTQVTTWACSSAKSCTLKEAIYTSHVSGTRVSASPVRLHEDDSDETNSAEFSRRHVLIRVMRATMELAWYFGHSRRFRGRARMRGRRLSGQEDYGPIQVGSVWQMRPDHRLLTDTQMTGFRRSRFQRGTENEGERLGLLVARAWAIATKTCPFSFGPSVRDAASPSCPGPGVQCHLLDSTSRLVDGLTYCALL